MLRTCYSFVIYNRDFSSALNDVNGDSIAQGSQDIAARAGTQIDTAGGLGARQTVDKAIR